MFRLLVVLLVLAISGLAATVRLYLKDGTYHLVREYQVKSDRVRFYSVERSQWEEIPLSLIDLKRTEAEIKEKQEALRKEAAALSAEDQAEREQEREISRIPQEKGVYLVDGEQLRPVPQAEVQVVSNKRRSVLRVLVPVPVVAGKSTAELNGETSPNRVATGQPEFYIRLWAEERFGIIRLTRQKGTRLVEKWSIIPVTNEIIEEHDEVEIFRRQVGDGLYKIWPQKPLEPGEYAVAEFTPGKGNIQVWDFSYNPAPTPANK
jgi:hypothetical protein